MADKRNLVRSGLNMASHERAAKIVSLGGTGVASFRLESLLMVKLKFLLPFQLPTSAKKLGHRVGSGVRSQAPFLKSHGQARRRSWAAGVLPSAASDPGGGAGVIFAAQLLAF